jgi:hypothetical protein
MIEEWRQIPGLPSYEASDLGRIRSLKSGRGVINPIGHVLSSCPDLKGYQLVNCRIDGMSRTQRVHRLIARAFIGEIPNGHQINHINGKKDDNRLVNLEIVSPSQNLRHRHEVLKIDIKWRGSRHGLSKLTESNVKKIRARHQQGELLASLAKAYGVTTGTISAAIHRKTWTHVD